MSSTTFTAFSRITAHWQSTIESRNEFSRLFTESVLRTWRINLKLGEAILGGRIRAAPALDGMGVDAQGWAQFATPMHAEQTPVAPARPPETMHAVPDTGAPGTDGGAIRDEEAERAAQDDEEWRLAEQAYLDTAGEDMHAEGHVQTAAPVTAAPGRTT